MGTLRIEGLPDDPLAAAAEFHSRIAPQISAAAGERQSVALLFAPAGYEHDDWRHAAVATLARAMAPLRINGVVGSDANAIAAALAYVESAAGLTGQLLTLDGEGAGPVV